MSETVALPANVGIDRFEVFFRRRGSAIDRAYPRNDEQKKRIRPLEPATFVEVAHLDTFRPASALDVERLVLWRSLAADA